MTFLKEFIAVYKENAAEIALISVFISGAALAFVVLFFPNLMDAYVASIPLLCGVKTCHFIAFINVFIVVNVAVLALCFLGNLKKK